MERCPIKKLKSKVKPPRPAITTTHRANKALDDEPLPDPVIKFEAHGHTEFGARPSKIAAKQS